MATRYSNAQLMEMAQEVMEAKKNRNDDRYMLLVLGISVNFGMHPHTIQEKIAEYAEGKFEEVPDPDMDDLRLFPGLPKPFTVRQLVEIGRWNMEQVKFWTIPAYAS
jgi:hypothetical protein